MLQGPSSEYVVAPKPKPASSDEVTLGLGLFFWGFGLSVQGSGFIGLRVHETFRALRKVKKQSGFRLGYKA